MTASIKEPMTFAPVLKGEDAMGEANSIEYDCQPSKAKSTSDSLVFSPCCRRTTWSLTCKIVGKPWIPNRAPTAVIRKYMRVCTEVMLHIVVAFLSMPANHSGMANWDKTEKGR